MPRGYLICEFGISQLNYTTEDLSGDVPRNLVVDKYSHLPGGGKYYHPEGVSISYVNTVHGPGVHEQVIISESRIDRQFKSAILVSDDYFNEVVTEFEKTI